MQFYFATLITISCLLFVSSAVKVDILWAEKRGEIKKVRVLLNNGEKLRAEPSSGTPKASVDIGKIGDIKSIVLVKKDGSKNSIEFDKDQMFLKSPCPHAKNVILLDDIKFHKTGPGNSTKNLERRKKNNDKSKPY